MTDILSQLDPFDPTDPLDAVADRARRKIAAYGLVLLSDPEFRARPPERQIECATAGILTALMGILHAFVPDVTEVHDAIERAVISYVPQARAAAEQIANSREPGRETRN